MSAITLYKASAGAGKTFQLTGEYLRLMFNPEIQFSKILAVTFTNKATAEMSDRILKELYLLALGHETEHAKMLKATFGLTNAELQKQAKFNLNQVLHNYTRFNISTIDSFFQKILKSFTREVGLNVGFNVELNQSQVVEDAVLRLFERFHENVPLQKWLLNYSKNNLETGKTWDVQKQLIRFANEALGEVFMGLSQEELKQMSDLSVFENYKKTLLKLIYDFEKDLNAIGEKAMNLIQAFDLSVDDFSYKKAGPAGYLEKISTIRYFNIKEGPSKRIIGVALADDFISGWVAKKSKIADQVQACVQKGLKQCAIDVLQLFEAKGKHFFTAQAILNQLDAYAILVEVFSELVAYSDEQNIFLLSMASPLLSKMIGKDDASFIYEKTGEALHHFMIDEFQDTSNVQWRNFFPLFHNGVSQGFQSVIVGDIKQSIYRWRSGDWSLLDHKVKEQFSNYSVAEKNLPFNWRSEGNVISFNNWLFRYGSEMLQRALNESVDESALSESQQEAFTRIYSNAEQTIPNAEKLNKGFVKVQFFEKVTKQQDSEEDGMEVEVLERTLAAILELHSKGYEPKDIAIIVRRNTEGAMIAQYLMEQMKQYPEQKEMLRFISNDSVFLESSNAVRLIISLLQMVLSPNDKLFKAQVLKLHLSRVMDDYKIMNLLSSIDFEDDAVYFAQLPVDFKTKLPELRQLSLVDLVDQLIKIFLIDAFDSESFEKEQVFLETFQDYVLDLAVKQHFDVAMLLTWWEDGGSKKPINISEQQNAMRIITIHKSKGLEFGAVIIPFLNWDFDQRSKMLWVKPDVEPFNQLQMVPIMYGSLLKNTLFSKSYYDEQLLAWVDNFNLLYVALTRAEKALYMFAPKPPKSGKFNGVGTLLFHMINSENVISHLNNETTYRWDEEDGILEFGSLAELVQKETKEQVAIDKTYQRIDRSLEGLGIRQHALSFFLVEENVSSSSKGMFLHKVFEQIKYIDDVATVVDGFVRDGILSIDEGANTKQVILSAIDACGVGHWFSKEGNKIYNERSFILKDGSIKRPDRIMFINNELLVVDYKFTHKESAAHKSQVKEYMEALALIEKVPVKGFLWYVDLNKVVEVA